MKRIALKQPQVPEFVAGATTLWIPVKPQPTYNAELEMWAWPDVCAGYASMYPEYALCGTLIEFCPYPVGSELALTETWRATDVAPAPDASWFDYRVEYRHGSGSCWHGLSAQRAAQLHVSLLLDWSQSVFNPPITMPAEFSRFKRRVTAVSVEHGELWEWVLELEAV